jgi:hypothetical protein
MKGPRGAKKATATRHAPGWTNGKGAARLTPNWQPRRGSLAKSWRRGEMKGRSVAASLLRRSGCQRCLGRGWSVAGPCRSTNGWPPWCDAPVAKRVGWHAVSPWPRWSRTPLGAIARYRLDRGPLCGFLWRENSPGFFLSLAAGGENDVASWPKPQR